MTVSPSRRVWVLRLQWSASLKPTSVRSSCRLSSPALGLVALDWLTAAWFVILPVDTKARDKSQEYSHIRDRLYLGIGEWQPSKKLPSGFIVQWTYVYFQFRMKFDICMLTMKCSVLTNCSLAKYPNIISPLTPKSRPLVHFQ